MKLTFIGMSGAGKTYWAKKLERKGFARYSADDFIETKLAQELKQYGYSGIHDMAQWMGHPYDERYPARSKRYLELERKVMLEIIRMLKHNSEDTVVDTTGSIVYLNQEILEELSQISKVVYFTTPVSQRQMYIQFLADPKPVIWGNQFNRRADETPEQALARCYPRLLQYRIDLYKKYAHFTLEFDRIRNKGFHVDQLLEFNSTI